jgi:N-acetylglucosaminyl-diphospho-decaprenol L-rhamnosyltransferase
VTAVNALSIVIVTWNSAEQLDACLRSFRAHSPSRPHRIVVVDNASSDHSASVAMRYEGVELLANETNLGLAAANDQGMRAAPADAFLLCNPDIEVGSGAVDALVDLLERRPRAAFAVPRLRYPDGRGQTSVGDLPTLREALLGGRRRSGQTADTGYWWHTWGHDVERRVGRGAEACYLVRAAAVDEVGFQDPRFPLDWEGIDWTRRMRDHGWEIWFTPDAEVVHIGGSSIRQAPYRWAVQSHIGLYRYFAPRLPRPLRPLLATAVAARSLAKMLITATGTSTYELARRRHRADP